MTPIQTSNGMRVFVCTQAVDERDPVLGFFTRWLEEMAKERDLIVVCLRKGTHHLPNNVEIISLGERHKIFRAFELNSIAWGRRGEYDAVFVHMNPEYLVAAGWLWKLLGKKIVLWYTHKSVNLRLHTAAFFADTILTASKESFRLASRKVHVLGHGIDTDFFTPSHTERGDHVISVGRLTKSKRHDLAIRAAHAAGKSLRVIGEGPEKEALEKLSREIGANVTFLGGLTQEALRNEYKHARYLIHTSETGSLDKVVLEALACDCAVVTTSDVYREYPVQIVAATPEAISTALQRGPVRADADIIRKNHSLKALIPRIIEAIRV